MNAGPFAVSGARLDPAMSQPGSNRLLLRYDKVDCRLGCCSRVNLSGVAAGWSGRGVPTIAEMVESAPSKAAPFNVTLAGRRLSDRGDGTTPRSGQIKSFRGAGVSFHQAVRPRCVTS